MPGIIEPKVLKGFRDFLPASEIARKTLIERVEQVYRLYGYVPIDTPALEYSEILLGKGGGETEKQVYRFTDAGGRDVALRFDLTVPLARFTASHLGELDLPFKRYHIAKVWRGENTQRGRYREFTQCDCDSVGEDDAAADFEILCMMHGALQKICSRKITIQLNHRGLFNRFLERLGVKEKSADILRSVDKRSKIGCAGVRDLLSGFTSPDAAEKILDYIESSGSWKSVLDKITEAAGGRCAESERLEAIYGFLEDAGISGSFVLNPAITRGLDYYTGVVYETFLDDMPEIGSVCSGGRYDNLALLYTKQKLSGVGASIGLDRLLAGLAALNRQKERRSYAALAFAVCEDADWGFYQRLASCFREAGLGCEILPANIKKLAAFYANAEKRGLLYAAVLAQSATAARDACGGAKNITLRRLDSRKDSRGLSVKEAVDFIKLDMAAPGEETGAPYMDA
ncbi:MAG: histidine--tRNA ligase [Spirochaetaceae bacterium]|jgi:histidyl-tRNA synthetase|nr:histidine--tRNA ligase [Spirochaetaceae bacterium]